MLKEKLDRSITARALAMQPEVLVLLVFQLLVLGRLELCRPFFYAHMILQNTCINLKRGDRYWISIDRNNCLNENPSKPAIYPII
jgi:hypothetical protein